MSPAHEARLHARSGALQTHTSGLAAGHMQANLLVLPSAAAEDFRHLCARNPVPCPLLAWSSRGDPHRISNPSLFAHAFDLRTDLPTYTVYRPGQPVTTRPDLLDDWTPDHVAFLVGCSFSFDAALAAAGLTPRHLEQTSNVPMFRTTRPMNPAGIFTDAHYVVSMRPYRPEDVDRVRAVTRPYLAVHGEPIAWGWDAMTELGIADAANPDFGDAVAFCQGEVPVFWGCGVTPQVAVMEARSKINGTVMGHAPGHMLILDVTEDEMFGSPTTNGGATID